MTDAGAASPAPKGGQGASTRIFVLSPADLSGVRGRLVLSGTPGPPFMRVLLEGGSVPLGEVLSFVSSLYYRGKRLCGNTFGRRPDGGPTTLAITSNRGLVPDAERVDLAGLRALAGTAIEPDDPVYNRSLGASARRLADSLEGGDVVLLGSIATPRYLEPLAAVFGTRLLFPRAFVGRGDMSRGGLMLRAVESREELEYVTAIDAPRRGPRPPKLPGR